MYCEKCGANNFETTRRCITCGADLLAPFSRSQAEDEIELPPENLKGEGVSLLGLVMTTFAVWVGMVAGIVFYTAVIPTSPIVWSLFFGLIPFAYLLAKKALRTKLEK